MEQSHHTKNQRRPQVVTALIIAVGTAVLLLGIVKTLPYVRSRLATPRLVQAPGPAQVLDSSPQPPTVSPDFPPTAVFQPTGDSTPTSGPPLITVETGQTATEKSAESALASSTETPSPTRAPVDTGTASPELALAATALPDVDVVTQFSGISGAIPTRILIPKINVDAPVVAASTVQVEIDAQTQSVWEVPDAYAAGWHKTSAPLGVAGNTVLNGHNTTNGEVFRELFTLDAGDRIVAFSGDTQYAYSVSEVLVLPEGGQPLEVRTANAQYILHTPDERLTLVTCHPYGSLRNRLIVIAQPDRVE